MDGGEAEEKQFNKILKNNEKVSEFWGLCGFNSFNSQKMRKESRQSNAYNLSIYLYYQLAFITNRIFLYYSSRINVHYI